MTDLPDRPRYGPFVIEAHLGTGGMGRIYRAVDTRRQAHLEGEARS